MSQWRQVEGGVGLQRVSAVRAVRQARAVETMGINAENIAPSCASMHQVPAEAPTHPYWPRIDDEGRCERTARLPVSRSSTTPKRLLRGPCAHSGINRSTRSETSE